MPKPDEFLFYEKYQITTKVRLSNELELEEFCYRWHDLLVANGCQVLDRAAHFKNIAHILWGSDNKMAHFMWHPWAEKMNEVSHRTKYPAFSGGGSTGKTDFAAIFALINWKVAPSDTIVLPTTTGLKDAQRRIWGAIEKYFMASSVEMPGKIVGSKYEIYTTDDNGVRIPKCGIQLLAGDKNKEEDNMRTLIGAKAQRVFLLADELPELSHNLLKTFRANLDLNPFALMMGLGNFKGRYDSFGEFMQPKNGWKSYDVDDEEWETEVGGICAHFDGMKSPNVLLGENRYPGIYNMTNLVNHRKLGENSSDFWRMCRSFETPIGTEDALYSESDFRAGLAYDVPGENFRWISEKTRVSAMDPAFTSGGDRCVQRFGELGIIEGGLMVLWLYKKVLLNDDARFVDKTRSRQIAEQFINNCKQEGVDPQNAALDATAGGGTTLADFISELWLDPKGNMIGNKVLRVDFSGAVSDSFVGHKSAKDSFDRRVSELWGIGTEYFKYGQIKGMTDELAMELTARKKLPGIKGPEGLKLRVETKRDMKKRMGYSPDDGDTFFILLDLCRTRLRFVARAPDSMYARKNDNWIKQFKLANAIHEHADYTTVE